MKLTYAADRSAMHRANLGWYVAMGFELVALSALLLALVPGWPWKALSVAALMMVTTGAIHRGMHAPARTAHALSEDELTLRYGAWSWTVQRHAIASVDRIDDHTRPEYVAGPRVDESRHELQLPFSRRGQLVVTFRRDLDVAVGDDTYTVRQVLINLDDPAALIARLGSGPAIDSVGEPAAASVPARQRSHERASGPIAVQTFDLAYRVGERAIVDGLNITVHAGEICGFAGPNGSGKSTTIEMIVGLLRPNGGRIEIGGVDRAVDPSLARRRVGYVPDRAILYDALTGREQLDIFGAMRGMASGQVGERIVALEQVLALGTAIDAPAGSYSLGMRRKLSILLALLSEPSVLVLDEPFNGLDPDTSDRLHELLSHVADAGTAVIVSLHDPRRLSALCDSTVMFEDARAVQAWANAPVDAPDVMELR